MWLVNWFALFSPAYFTPPFPGCRCLPLSLKNNKKTKQKNPLSNKSVKRAEVFDAISASILFDSCKCEPRCFFSPRRTALSFQFCLIVKLKVTRSGLQCSGKSLEGSEEAPKMLHFAAIQWSPIGLHARSWFSSFGSFALFQFTCFLCIVKEDQEQPFLVVVPIGCHSFAYGQHTTK